MGKKKHLLKTHKKSTKKIPLNKGSETAESVFLQTSQTPDIEPWRHCLRLILLLKTYLQISESWRAGRGGGNGRETCFTVHRSGRTQTDIPRGNYGPQTRLICVFSCEHTKENLCVNTSKTRRTCKRNTACLPATSNSEGAETSERNVLNSSPNEVAIEPLIIHHSLITSQSRHAAAVCWMDVKVWISAERVPNSVGFNSIKHFLLCARNVGVPSCSSQSVVFIYFFLFWGRKLLWMLTKETTARVALYFIIISCEKSKSIRWDVSKSVRQFDGKPFIPPSDGETRLILTDGTVCVYVLGSVVSGSPSFYDSETTTKKEKRWGLY